MISLEKAKAHGEVSGIMAAIFKPTQEHRDVARRRRSFIEQLRCLGVDIAEAMWALTMWPVGKVRYRIENTKMIGWSEFIKGKEETK